MKKMLVVIISLFAVGFSAFGSSFGAFGGISEGISVSPAFYVPIDPFVGFGMDITAAFGVLPKFELYVNFSTLWFMDGNFYWGGFYVVPRYDLGGLSILEFNILASKLSYSDSFGLGVEYHTALGLLKDLLSIEFNAGLGIIPSVNLYSIVAPVLYLSELIGFPGGVYFEVDIGSDLSSFEVGYIVGFFFEKDKFSLNLGYDFSKQVVGWISISF